MSYGLIYHTPETTVPYDLFSMKIAREEDLCINKEVYVGATDRYNHWYCSARVVEISSKNVKLQGAYKIYIAVQNDLGYFVVTCFWNKLPSFRDVKLDWKYGF